MDRRTFLKATGAAGGAAALTNVAQAHEGTHQSSGGASEELLVTYDDGADPEAVRADLAEEGEVLDHNPYLNFFHVELPSSMGEYGTLQAESRIVRKPGVKQTDLNHEVYPHAVEPDDRLFDEQYAPQQTRADHAWEKTFGSEDVTIAIIDQGVDYEHPDLKDQFGENKGKDFLDDGDDDPMPENKSEEYHGTHVAGIAAASPDNGTGVAGQSDSKLLSCRALGVRGGSLKAIADAIRWATDNGADIINMSLGGGGRSDVGKNAVSYALENGTLPFASAGNACAPQAGFPARYDEVVAVSAIGPDENLASFSNYGPNVEITGPGVDVLSCWTEVPQDDPYGGKYNKISGTSMSCPAVAGVAALGLAANPDLSATELRQKLKETAVDVGLDEEEQGAGRADAVRLVGGVGEGQEDAGPTANLTATPSDPHVGENVYVTGFDSTDPDGYIDAWEYDFGDGATATGEKQVHSYDEPGEYTIELTVTDEDGQTSTASTTVDVQSGACGVSAEEKTYSGTVESSEQRDTKTYAFQTDEPCKVQLDIEGNDDFILYAAQRSADFLQTECQNQVVLRPRDLRKLDTSQDLTIGIYAGDGQRAPSGDYTVTVQETGFESSGDGGNEAPTASFTPDSPTVVPGKAISFDASGSSDPDGSIESYEWEFGDGATASGETTTHAYGSAGSYEVTLTVTDDAGKSASTSTTVTVESENAEPDAEFEAGRTEVEPDTQVTFDASESSDPDDTIQTYRWDFDDGTTTTGETVRHAFDTSGDYQVELTVTDVDGASDSATKTIDVTGGDPGKGKCGDSTTSTTETGSLSGSSDAQAYTYATELANPCKVKVKLSAADGTDYDLYMTLDGRTPTPDDYDRRSFNYGSDEEIEVEGDAVSADAEFGILVDAYSGSGAFELDIQESGTGSGGGEPEPPENEAPEADFAASRTSITAGQSVSFDGSVSTDPDGSIESYEWEFGDGGTATARMVEYTYTEPGSYEVSLTVTDDDGASDTATTTIEVAAADRECGSSTMTDTASGMLSSSWDDATFTYEPETSSPCQITLELSGPTGTDFDLYATTDGRTPSSYDFDKKSATPTSDEKIVLDDLSASSEIGILVEAWSGSGSFEIAVEELGK